MDVSKFNWLLGISLCVFMFVCQCPAGKSKNSESNGLDEHGVRSPTSCEVCKYFATELEARFELTGKSHDVLELGYRIDGQKKRKKYKHSETRFEESVDGVCEEILKYNVHAERSGSLRYAKGQSQTMGTLHGLKNKGVKVELGIPYEMWDSPHAEITEMKRQCETMLEKYEEIVEEWYNGNQNVRLRDYLCKDVILADSDPGCLDEVAPPPSKKGDNGDAGKTGEKAGKKGKKKKSITDKEVPAQTSEKSDDAKKMSDETKEQGVRTEL